MYIKVQKRKGEKGTFGDKNKQINKQKGGVTEVQNRTISLLQAYFLVAID